MKNSTLAEIHHFSKNMVYLTFVHIQLAKMSHMTKPNTNEVEMNNPPTGNVGENTIIITKSTLSEWQSELDNVRSKHY